MATVWERRFWNACMSGNVEQFMDIYDQVDVKIQDEGFKKAIEKKQKVIVEKFLKKGINVNAKDEKKSTPLHIAAEKGNIDVLELLLKKGANVEDIDVFGETPLTFACSAGHGEIVQMLLAYGANPNFTPEVKGVKTILPIYTAVNANRADVIRILLLNGTDPSVRNPKLTPLQKAFASNKKAAELVLITPTYSLRAMKRVLRFCRLLRKCATGKMFRKLIALKLISRELTKSWLSAPNFEPFFAGAMEKKTLGKRSERYPIPQFMSTIIIEIVNSEEQQQKQQKQKSSKISK